MRAFHPADPAIGIEDAVDLGEERRLRETEASHERVAIGEGVAAAAFHAGAMTGRECGHLVAEEELGIAVAPDLPAAALEREHAAEPVLCRLDARGHLATLGIMEAPAAIAEEQPAGRIGEEGAIGADAIGQGHACFMQG